MLIDWFTVVAQVLNFVILVWLMKRYLFHPILNAIAAREEKIVKQLAEADTAMDEAHKKQAEFDEKNRALEQQKKALLQQATHAAEVEGERLRAEAIEAVEHANAARAKAVLADTQLLHSDLVHRTQAQVLDITRRVLEDLSDTQLEQHICAAFIRKLNQIDDKTLEQLRDRLSARSASKSALVKTAFALSDVQKTELCLALESVLGSGIEVKFEVYQDLVAGIELSANGQKLAWSISDFLHHLSFSPLVDRHKPEQQEAQ